MGSAIWLASYPKSGNTWMRVFLTNYYRDAQEPADINDLDYSTIAADRALFDEETGVEASDLSEAEIARWRPEVLRRFVEAQPGQVFIKIHDAYRPTVDGVPTVLADSTAGVIYMLRNPLSVALSWAHHVGRGADHAIGVLADENFTLSTQDRRLAAHLPQRVLSWSAHVRSWVEHGPQPHCIVRYEDMVRQPVETFSSVIAFLDGRVDAERVRRAVVFSDLKQLQAQEVQHGFKERLARSSAQFFRQGRTDAWRDELTASQIARVIADHGATMRRFGYLDARNIPTD